MDFSKTRISAGRPLNDYSRVRSLMGRLLRGRRFQVNRALATGKRLLNVGCGPHVHPDFINLDYEWVPKLDLCWDLAQGIPLPDGSIEAAYSEHCLEHLPIDLTRATLREMLRVMRPGAVLRVVVPDAELYLDLYQRSKETGPAPDFPYVGSRVRSGELTPMMAVNAVFREHGHQFAYDFATLAKLLAEAGFESVTRRSFREGSDTCLHIDHAGRAVESLYVEAVKPR